MKNCGINNFSFYKIDGTGTILVPVNQYTIFFVNVVQKVEKGFVKRQY